MKPSIKEQIELLQQKQSSSHYLYDFDYDKFVKIWNKTKLPRHIAEQYGLTLNQVNCRVRLCKRKGFKMKRFHPHLTKLCKVNVK